ncbi:MAG: response regulator [Spirochaetaceae bacterium]
MIDMLVADDHPIVRHGVREIVARAEDIRVLDEASDGPETVQKVRTKRYDVVLLDLVLPGLSGLEVVKQLRGEGRIVPVLFLSALPEEQYAVRSLRAGADGYLTKECAVDELISAIRTVAGGKRYVSPATAAALADYVAGSRADLPHDSLSDRELAVLTLIASGKTVGQIAAALHLGQTTVSTYRTRILQKMGMRTNAELTYYAVKENLV